MTDMTVGTPAAAARRIDTDSDAAQARIRARYRAERRFRAYGAATLVITTVFVVLVVVDILMKGMPAFWQHSLRLDVTVPADAVAAADRADPRAIRGIDFAPPIREALKAAVPGVRGRVPERTLTRLVSTGADDALRARILADPSLIGRPVTTRLLLSDDADLYFKGVGTRVVSRADTAGSVTPDAASGQVALALSSADLAPELAILKRAFSARAATLRAEADRLERRAGTAAAAEVRRMREEAAAYQARVERPAELETLDDRMPSLLVAVNGGLVKLTEISDRAARGEALLPLSSTAPAGPGAWKVVTYETAESNRKVSDREVAYLERLREAGAVERHFNTRFFTAGDSREPELAGLLGALVGSILTMAVTLALSLPIGVMAAVYLEEFAPKNRLTDLIEVNINNLAAVPSIVFGLLGLAVFLNFFGLPRSAPLVGGLVLALLVLPTIIIAARAAIKAVPPSIREAALGVGASHQQAVFHHVLPLAMPGIMTGTIIGMAHALGETAPLLMIGMIAFIVDIPGGFTDAATALPVQIYLWSDLPELAFQSKTAGAIIVLLAFLFLMNGLAIVLRKKFERRW